MSESAYQLLSRGSQFLARGHPHQAVMLLERAKLVEPEKGSIREALGRALYMTGRWARARREFAKAVAIDPVNDYAHYALGLTCARTGQRNRAIAHLKLAVAMSPRDEYRAALFAADRVTSGLPTGSAHADPQRTTSQARATPGVSLADRYEAFLLDVDGVLYRGDVPIEGAGEAVRDLRRRGRRVVFITNNSARTPLAVAEALVSLGVPASPDEVVTSAQAAIPLVAELIGPGGTVYAIGEEGVRAALRESGIALLEGEPDRADAVVVGWDRHASYDSLRVASVLVQRGARLVATNADASYPAPGGELWPGTGALLAAIEETTGTTAVVAGKPHGPLFDAALDRAGTRNALVVGDRLETDIAGASAAGLDSALVLTGAAETPHLLDHDALPVAILKDLSRISDERPETRIRPSASGDEEAVHTLVREAGLAETSTDGSGAGDSVVAVGPDDAPLAAATTKTHDDHAYLHSVAVRPHDQGLGLGTLVVAAAVGAARRRGATQCFLLTEGASGFFSKLGFVPTDRNDMPAWILELSRDCATSAVAMRRTLVQ